MEASKEIIEKVRLGDKLSDDELIAVISLYRTLVEGLALLGVQYSLARDPINRKLDELEWVATNRGIKV